MAVHGIGILGGSFDPVHNGHLAIASLVRDHLRLPTILFIPAALPPHKSLTVHATAEQRLAMLELATEQVRGTRVHRCEIERGGTSYTVDTLMSLRGEYHGQELFYIIGSDNLAEIPTWHRYREILSMVTLCVVHRPGYSMRPGAAVADARITSMPSPEWGVSSTMVRRYLLQDYSCEGLVPRSVLCYIRDHGLYQGTPHDTDYD